jgi:oligopeptide/dipeptide ABC transporter ATP-binding protein
MYGGRVVEAGPVEQIFTSPRHPYTQGLLDSMPSRSRRGERLRVIKGSVPNPFNMPRGCNFAPRCPARFEPCIEHDPELVAVEGAPESQVACWLHSEPPVMQPVADAEPASAAATEPAAEQAG